MVPRPDYNATIYWLTNNFGYNQKYFDVAVKALTAKPLHVFFYFFGLYAYSIAYGWLIHLVVRGFGIDKRFQLFRFDNDWYYQFTGEALDFPDYRPESSQGAEGPSDASVGMKYNEVTGTLVAAVVELKERSYLYLGIYVDSFYDAAGNLERILLAGAKRRELVKDVDGEADDLSHFGSTRYYPIKGDYFLLRMSEIKTLNLAYYSDEVFQLAVDSEKFEQLLDEIKKLETEQDVKSVVAEVPSSPDQVIQS